MGQSSSGEPQRELLYAEARGPGSQRFSFVGASRQDGITVIGSTFSVGGEKAAPEWFGMGPQRPDASICIRSIAQPFTLASLGFVGPGPQINPKALKIENS